MGTVTEAVGDLRTAPGRVVDMVTWCDTNSRERRARHGCIGAQDHMDRREETSSMDEANWVDYD